MLGKIVLGLLILMAVAVIVNPGLAPLAFNLAASLLWVLVWIVGIIFFGMFAFALVILAIQWFG